MGKQFEALLPDALLAKRFPIGTEEIIKSAPRKVFTDFYSQYYIPSRMTFIYVGDFDTAEAEKAHHRHLWQYEEPRRPWPRPKLGTIPSGQGFTTLIMADPEVATTDLTLLALKPYEKKPDTKANRGAQLHLALAHSILGRRFSVLAKKEDATISGGNAFRQDLF